MSHLSDTSKEFNFDTKVLRYLVGIVDEKSLSKAAEKFYISQPALSRCLKNVEQALGMPLFTHVRNRLEPTDAGKIFINGARSLLYIEQSALQQLKNLSQKNKHLSLWTEEWFSPSLTHFIIPDFQKSFPDIELELSVCDTLQIQNGLFSGSADIGLFFGDAAESPLFTCRPLFASRLVYCAAERRQPLSFLLSPAGTYLRHIQEQALQDQGLHNPHIAGELSWELMRELLQLGYGDAVIPEFLAAGSIAPERITPLTAPRSCCGILGLHAGRPLPEPAQFLCKLISDYYHKETFA